MPKRKPQTAPTVIERPCYTMAINGQHADMNMYGEIVETRPVDWWTGDPVSGDFIILDEFLRDLDTLATMSTITIHMNSIGGDAFASIAIYNRLRALIADITVIVDGVAMSGGSLIMCAANTVQANPSSLIMVHQCWTYFWDRVNSDDLIEASDKLAAIDRSQAEIYMAKTGKSMQEVLEIMRGERYMTGREAMELGFVDELVDQNVNPDISVSADHRTMYVRGHSMRVAAKGILPENITVIESEGVHDTQEDREGAPTHARTATGAVVAIGEDNNPPEPTGEKQGGHVIMTWEEFLRDNPEAAEAALAEARASVDTNAAADAERQRIADIDAIASVFDAETVNAAKYGENRCTAAEMAHRAALASVRQGTAFMSALQNDSKASGAENVPAASVPVEAENPLSNEDLIAAGMAAAKKMQEVK